MNTRPAVLAIIAPLVAGCALLAAGCGSAGSLPAGGGAASSVPVASSAGQATSPAPAAASGPAQSTAGTSSAAGPASPGSVTSTCPPADTVRIGAGLLTGLQFVSPAQGWAVGQDAILATSDGGAHWRAQLTGRLNLTSVDFISARDGWAVGMSTLLATTDGGAHWTPLPEPCAVIRSVHFISAATGFAVAGGRLAPGAGAPSGSVASPVLPAAGGLVLATRDGGRSWQAMTAPADAQTVCFSDPGHGWLGAGGLLYRSADGGRHWTALTSLAGQVGTPGAAAPVTMSVECAAGGTAWALRVGPGAAMSQDPHAGFHADQAGATAIFAEQYFQNQGAPPAAAAPGPYAGPFSALSPSAAVFFDWCDACGQGTVPWDLVTGSGASLTKEGNVPSITAPTAASFATSQAGAVAGTVTEYSSGSVQSRTQSRIVGTADGGRTWRVEYAGPWSAWTG
ncbi:MAG TPA: YCF48-related protein [Trebonia sp.]|jgi:photosystem II stability/assembly factor-like uncharacterized protein